MKKGPSILSVMLAMLSPAAFAVPGELDGSFGSGGQVVTPIGTNYDEAHGVAVQADGKLLVVGYAFNGSDADFALARYNSNGTLDSSFGSGGKVIAVSGSSNDYGNAVALQSDGKIVVAGYSSSGTNHDFELLRYNTSGTLDGTFGTAGKVITAIGSGHDYGNSVVLQSDGKILVAGSATVGGALDFALVRYNSNGTLDGTFGSGGKVTTAIGSSNDAGNGLAVQSDGKIVVAGNSIVGGAYDIAVVRYNADGTLDGTFGSGGKVTTAIGSGNDAGKGVVVQSDGKIVVAGSSSNGSNTDVAVVRFQTNGMLDLGFGNGGKVIASLGTGDDYSTAIVVQSDQKIVVAGTTVQTDTGNDVAVVRYNTDGTLDNSFGNGGEAITSVGSNFDYGYGMAIQADGKIVVAGQALGAGGADFAMVRYLGDAEIVVEQPAGSDLADGGSRSFGGVAVTGNRNFTFTVRNAGTSDLTGLGITSDGADFIVTASPSVRVLPGASTTFTVAFSPNTGGAKAGALHLASNDSDENPFDINLTGTGLTFTNDTDGDGLNDAAEFNLAALGFDWQVAQPALVAVLSTNAAGAGLYTQAQFDANRTAGRNEVINSPNGFGLYTLSQVQTLNADVPLLTRDAGGSFKLTFGIQKATSLDDGFSPFPFVGGQTMINAEGKIEFTFTVPNDAAFFRVEAR